MKVLVVIGVLALAVGSAGCSSGSAEPPLAADVEGTEIYQELLSSQPGDWDVVFDLENGSEDAKLFWQKRSSSFRLDAVSHQSSTLVGETLIEGDAGLGAHCYWVVEDKVADALCYPRMGRGELSPRDAFLDGLPLFKILSADVDAELLSHSAENKIRCFRVQQLEPLADVCLSAAGVPTSVETDSARITLRSQSADPRPFASGAVIPGAETSRDDVVEAHERPSFELVLPEWILSEFDEPAP